MKPKVTRKEVENFKKTATLPWGLQAVEVMDRCLAERDEAIRDIEILKDQLMAEQDGRDEEKRRAAAYKSVAHRLAADYTTADFDVDAEAQKLLADSGGEKDFKSQQKGDSKNERN